jgi:hypothetical protein
VERMRACLFKVDGAVKRRRGKGGLQSRDTKTSMSLWNAFPDSSVDTETLTVYTNLGTSLWLQQGQNRSIEVPRDLARKKIKS